MDKKFAALGNRKELLPLKSLGFDIYDCMDFEKAKALIEQGKKDEAKKLLQEIYKALDKAAKTKTIKKNTASRKKSRISKLLKKASKAKTN